MGDFNKDDEKLGEGGDLATELAIDSIAPLEKILRDLLHRENFSKAYKFYRHLLVQRRRILARTDNYHYALPGHPIKYFESGWDGNISPDYFEPFPYRSTMPKFISMLRNVQKTDPVTDCLKIKSAWTNEVKFMKKLGGKVSKFVRRLNDDVMQVSKCVIELAALLEKDPDPNLDATYNWYYSGNGSLQLICINWVDYLLHSEFSVVYLTRIHKDKTSIESEPTTSFDCETDNILESTCSSQNIVALRTKHKVIILKIIENDDKINFVKLKQFESEVPFTNVSFDNYHTNILYTTTVDSNLKIVNIDRIKARSVKTDRKTTTNVNNWNCVIGGERATYAHVENSAVTFYDKRCNSAVNAWTNLRRITDEIHCNDITAAKRCDDSPTLYFTSDHHVFLMDTRCTRSSKPRPLVRWTHGLRCVPTYLSIGKAENNGELLALSSQWCEDTCLVHNYADCVARACDVRVSVPFHPPGVLDVLQDARMKMMCFDIANPIDGRLVTSVTGQVLYEQGENSILLTHNSLGDIAYRTIYPQYMETFIEDDSVQKLHEWSQAYKLERKEYEVSKIINIASVWENLRKVPQDYEVVSRGQEFVVDENKVAEAFANSELLPELLDAWEEPKARADDDDDDESFALNLYFDDSIV